MSERVSARFTPGPWDFDGAEIVGRKGRRIISDYGAYEGMAWGDAIHGMDEAEIAANKALIATAPELYAILDAFIHTPCQQPSRFAELQVQAAEIMARARGETIA